MINNINDRTIVNLIRKGDSLAYSLLYDKYAPLLYGIISRIVKDQAIAEKILEKTILHVWEDRASLDPEKLSVSTWMMNIARKFAKHEKELDEPKEDIELPESLCMLELVITKGFNIKQAANCLRISVSEALVKLREELKQSTSLKN